MDWRRCSFGGIGAEAAYKYKQQMEKNPKEYVDECIYIYLRGTTN